MKTDPFEGVLRYTLDARGRMLTVVPSTTRVRAPQPVRTHFWEWVYTARLPNEHAAAGQCPFLLQPFRGLVR